MIQPDVPREINPSLFMGSTPASSETTKSLPTPTYPSPAEWPTRDFRAKVVNSAYREMTENRVDKSKGEQAWIEMDARLDKIPDRQQKIAALCKALLSQDWSAEIFADAEQLPDIALAALRDQKLNSTQFATVMSFWAIRQHHLPKDIQVITIFQPDGSLNPLAERILQQTIRKAGDYASVSSFETFTAEVAKLPLSEQILFVVPDLEKEFPSTERRDPSVIQIKQKISIGQSLRFSADFGIFAKYDDDKDKRLIPSLGLQQAYLNSSTLYPVTLIPTVGLFPSEEMEAHGNNQTRPFAVPFPNSDYPDEVDSFKTPLLYDVTWHDFNHAVRASFVPPKHQKAIMALASGINQFKTVDPTLKVVLDKFYDSLMDMDFPLYTRKDIKHPLIDAMNMGLALGVQSAVLAQTIKKYKSGEIADEQIEEAKAQVEMEIQNVLMSHSKALFAQLAQHCTPTIKKLEVMPQKDLAAFNAKLLEEERLHNADAHEVIRIFLLSPHLEDAMKA